MRVRINCEWSPFHGEIGTRLETNSGYGYQNVQHSDASLVMLDKQPWPLTDKAVAFRDDYIEPLN